MGYKNFIFDFDGTMLNSGMFSFEFLKRYCDKPMDLDELRNKTTREMLEFFGFNRLKITYLLLKGRRELLRRHAEVTMEPGIHQLFKDLVAKGMPIYIVSSNSKRNIRTILKSNDLLSPIKDISSSISVFGKRKKLLQLIKKHGLDPKDTIYIGDETRDIEAAHGSGIAAGAVAWGYNSLEVLGRYNPEHAFQSPEDIRALIDGPAAQLKQSGGC